MGKFDNCNKWIKKKPRKPRYPDLVALEKSIAKRKKNLKKLKKRAHDAAVIEAMRQRCIRLSNEAERKFEQRLLDKWGY